MPQGLLAAGGGVHFDAMSILQVHARRFKRAVGWRVAPDSSRCYSETGEASARRLHIASHSAPIKVSAMHAEAIAKTINKRSLVRDFTTHVPTITDDMGRGTGLAEG